MDRGAWWATGQGVAKEQDKTEQLSTSRPRWGWGVTTCAHDGTLGDHGDVLKLEYSESTLVSMCSRV